MTPHEDLFVTKQPQQSFPSVCTTDGTRLPVTSGGHVSTSHLSLPNTFHVPKFSISLVSVSQLCDSNVLFTLSGCLVQDPKTDETLGIGHRVRRLL